MTAPDTKSLPSGFTDNPHKWDELVASFAPRQVVAAVLSTVAFTGIGQILSRVIGGRFSIGGASGVLVPWLLAAAMIVAVTIARRRILAAKARVIPAVVWVLGVIQVFWVASLAWYTEPVFSIVLAAGLCAIAFHDARYFYNATSLHLHYLLVWPAFFLFLLVVDLCGGHGLLARAASQPHYLRTAIPIIVGVMLVLQLVVSVVGQQWRELDGKMWAHGQLQAQLAEMRREREVIVRSCDFLVQGLAAGRFSHDVASPVSTVALTVGEMADGLREMEALVAKGDIRGEDAQALVKRLQAATDRIGRGHARIHEMAMTMSHSLRGETTSVSTTMEALLDDALASLRTSLERHKVAYLAPFADVVPSKLQVSGEHAAALGSIMCNGILQNPLEPLRVHGRPANEWFYVIAVRDFGVDGAARDTALARVRQQLALVEPGTGAAAPRSYEGFGMGLVLAKILFLRHNGCLSVASPNTGRGLLFVMVVPRSPIADIPVSENSPERIAEKWAEILSSEPAGSDLPPREAAYSRSRL